jgi:2-isopropylmalate synthase
MNRHEKLRMAHQLDRLGVDVIEAGFPIASDGEFRAVQVVAQEIRRALVRTRPSGGIGADLDLEQTQHG